MRRRFSIRGKLVAVGLVIAVPLAFVLSLTYYTWYEAQSRSLRSERLGYATLAAETFTQMIDSMHASMAVASANAFSAGGPGTAARMAFLTRLKEQYPVSEVVVTDSRGDVVAATDTRLVGTSLARESAFAEVLSGRSRSGIEPAREHPDGTTGFHVTKALIGPDGARTGAIGMLVDVTLLPEALAIRVENGAASIIDSAGHIVFNSQDPRLAREMLDVGTYPFVERALRGKTATTDDWTSPLGGRRIAAFVPIEPYGWAAGSAVPADAVLSPIRSSLAQAIAAMGIVLLVAGIAGVVVASSVVRSLAALAGGAERIGSGEFDRPVSVRTGDEVEDVARVLDRVRLDLRRQMDDLHALERAGREVASAAGRGPEALREAIVATASGLLGQRSIFIRLQERDGSLQTFLWEGPGDGSCRAPIDAADGSPVAIAFRERRPVVVPDAAAEPDALQPMCASELGVRSFAIMPLAVGDRVFGVLGVMSADVAAWTRGGRETDVLAVYAAQVAVALDNARLYAEERNVADTLQRAILAVPEHIEGLRFGHLYRSAAITAQVGGDFYDLFELEHRRVGVLLGDVSGKGLQAATLTSLVKNTIRAYAYEGDEPSQVVAKTSEVVRRESAASVFVTLFYGVLDLDSCAFTYCNAGHPPALLISADTEIGLLAPTSPLVGVIEGLTCGQEEIEVRRGDCILLYTDGIIEARRGDELFGEERLVEAIPALWHLPPEELPEAVYRTVEAFTDGGLTDDVAILSVSIGHVDGRDDC